MSTSLAFRIVLVVALVTGCSRPRSDSDPAPAGAGEPGGKDQPNDQGKDKGAGGQKAVTGDDKDLPRTGPGDPAITYDEVAKNPAKFHGKRVVWTAEATTGSGTEAAVAVNPEVKDARKYKMYAVRFATDKEVGDLFLGGKGRITGTVAGTLTITYEVSGPGGEAPQQRKETVPLLLYPTFESDRSK